MSDKWISTNVSRIYRDRAFIVRKETVWMRCCRKREMFRCIKSGVRSAFLQETGNAADSVTGEKRAIVVCAYKT